MRGLIENTNFSRPSVRTQKIVLRDNDAPNLLFRFFEVVRCWQQMMDRWRPVKVG